VTPVTEQQVLTSFCWFLKEKKKEASALVIVSAVGAKDLLFREHP